MNKILIKGGQVIDPVNKINEIMDILIDRGKVVAIDKNISTEAQIIDARDQVVCPGLIDMHVHLREPGREDEETIASGSQAAIAGGFTSLACMPNTNPVADNASVIEYIFEKESQENSINIYPLGAITKGLQGKKLVEMGELVRAGAVGFSNDGNPIMDAEVMRRALEYAKMFEVPVIVHAEDKNLSAEGQMNEGYFSTLLGLKGIPAAAEETMIARDLILAEMTGAKIHFAHISTEGSVRLIRNAKKRGVRVSCEVTPHHLLLRDSALTTFETNYKVNPPLRSQKDVEALKEGLADGTIDAIASDHAPHASQEKEREFIYAPFGVIGLETTLPLIITKIVGEKVIDLVAAIEKMTINPARILNIPKGELYLHKDVDILIFDPKAKVEIDVKKFYSQSRNSPFDGWQLQGVVTYLLVEGKLVKGKFEGKQVFHDRGVEKLYR